MPRPLDPDPPGAPRWRVLAGDAGALLDPPPAAGTAAVAVAAADGFADPPALAVRADVLDALGGPAPARAGALADLLDRVAAAGLPVVLRPPAAPPRPRTAAALLREGSGRFWLWRRRPAVRPLPRPREVGWWPYPLLVLGALHANAAPTRPAGAAGLTPAAARSRPDR